MASFFPVPCIRSILWLAPGSQADYGSARWMSNYLLKVLVVSYLVHVLKDCLHLERYTIHRLSASSHCDDPDSKIDSHVPRRSKATYALLLRHI